MTTEQRLERLERENRRAWGSFWRRPKTRSFVRLAWPALGAWVLTLIHVVERPGDVVLIIIADRWVYAGVSFASLFFYILALAYVFLAAAANAPIKVRLLACAANLSAPILGAFRLYWA